MSARAFAYLTAHSAKNRLLSRLRRAKNPRYALAVVLGGWYFWMVYLRPGSAAQRPHGIDTTGAMWMIIGTAVLLVMTAVAWFVPNGPSNLALDKAESAFILPAPVSRRGLVGYKIVRAQLAILMTVVVWTVLMRRGGTALALPLRALGVWIFFTTTNLHRTGAEIVRAAWSIRGGGALRKHWAAIGAIIAIIIGLAISIGLSYDAIVAAWTVGGKEALLAIAGAMRSGPALVVLWPIQATLGPMVAGSNREWLSAVPAALFVLAAHVLWVMRVDEEAVEVAVTTATERLEVMRNRAGRSKVGGPAIRPKPDAVLRTMPLAPTGWPAMAIVWKNVLAMRRKTRSVVPLLVIIGVFPIVLGGLMIADGKPASMVMAISAVSIAVLMLVVGPMVIRTDLRDDMLNITALKLMPLRGRSIVVAEITSVVVPLAIVEFFLLGLAAVMTLFAPQHPFGASQTVVLLAALLPAVVVFTAAYVTIQNAAPVVFPAWVKLGAITNGGMEAMGQVMIILAVFMVLLILMLLVPGAVAASIVLVGRSHLTIALFAALLVGAALLGAEVAALITVLGRMLERTEPSDVPTT